MKWRKLRGLAGLETTDSYSGHQIRIQSDSVMNRVLVTVTTSSPLILSTDATISLAKDLLAAVKEAKKNEEKSA